MSSIDTASDNPAVLRCIDAYKRRYEAEFEKRPDKVRAELAAEAEYRRVMPHLNGRKCIQDYIACVGHGMLIGTIEGRFGPKYLYAAQVALSALRANNDELAHLPEAEPAQCEPSSPSPETQA
ncbi:MAG TPA: hypothetical protein VKB38_19790, partial [Terracidiphilus sp.]|nr:hypothetical protein [Terracidiphilus sp.]